MILLTFGKHVLLKNDQMEQWERTLEMVFGSKVLIFTEYVEAIVPLIYGGAASCNSTICQMLNTALW